MTEPEHYWHVHHDILCEALSEPVQGRIDFIKKLKDQSEVGTMLRWMTPVLHPERLPAQWKEVEAKRKEAEAKWKEAYAKWKEAYAKWKEVEAKRKEAEAKWKEAYAKWKEAYAKWKEAYAKWKEAYAKWKEAYARRAPELEALHREEHPGCPWDGRTLFPKAEA